MSVDWEPSDVFISYAREDKPLVDLIRSSLEALNLRVWVDAQLKAGSVFGEEINREVSAAKCVLVLWSPRSIDSIWVRSEAQSGLEKGVLVAAGVGDFGTLPVPFNAIHAVDLGHWNGGSLDKKWLGLLREIGEKLGRPGLPEVHKMRSSSNPDELITFVRKFPTDPEAGLLWKKLEALYRGRFINLVEPENELGISFEDNLRASREADLQDHYKKFELWLAALKSEEDHPMPNVEFRWRESDPTRFAELEKTITILENENGRLRELNDSKEALNKLPASAIDVKPTSRRSGALLSAAILTMGTLIGVVGAYFTLHELGMSTEEAARERVSENRSVALEVEIQASEEFAEVIKVATQEVGLTGIIDVALDEQRNGNGDRAMEAYRVASEFGSDFAKIEQATAIYFGLGGIKKDQESALDLLIEVHDQSGIAKVTWLLGKEYYEGTHLSKDDVKAITFLQHASKAGEERALIDLARVYIAGDQVERDLERARRILIIAEESNHEIVRHDAQELLRIVERDSKLQSR